MKKALCHQHAGTEQSLFGLFLPVFVEYTLLMMVGTVDTVMLSFVSDTAVAAAGTVNTYLYLVSMIFTIMSTGALTVMTQYIGAGEPEVAHRARRLGVVFNAVAGSFFSILFLAASGQVLSFMATASAIFSDAELYMTMVGATMVFLAVTNVYSSYLRAFGCAKMTMIATAFANILNIVFNALFISMGWGIFGVALATIMARILNLVLVVIFSARIMPGTMPKAGIPDREIFGKIVRIGIPSAGELIIFNLSISFEMRCLNQMDSQGINAGVYSYCNQICNLIYCAAVALSQANGIIVGWRVGEGRFDESYRQTMRAAAYGTALSGGAAVLCVFITRPVLSLLTDNEAILSAVTLVMIINIFKELGRAGNYIIGTALKSSGDATITVIFGLISMPACAVLGSYVLGLRLGFGIYGAWAGMACDECFRCVLMYIRLRSGVWRSKALVSGGAEEKENKAGTGKISRMQKIA